MGQRLRILIVQDHPKLAVAIAGQSQVGFALDGSSTPGLRLRSRRRAGASSSPEGRSAKRGQEAGDDADGQRHPVVELRGDQHSQVHVQKSIVKQVPGLYDRIEDQHGHVGAERQSQPAISQVEQRDCVQQGGQRRTEEIDRQLPAEVKSRDRLDVEAGQAEVDQRELPRPNDERPLSSDEVKYDQMQALMDGQAWEEQEDGQSKGLQPC
jgi:hypothetical protein